MGREGVGPEERSGGENEHAQEWGVGGGEGGLIQDSGLLNQKQWDIGS